MKYLLLDRSCDKKENICCLNNLRESIYWIGKLNPYNVKLKKNKNPIGYWATINIGLKNLQKILRGYSLREIRLSTKIIKCTDIVKIKISKQIFCKIIKTIDNIYGQYDYEIKKDSLMQKEEISKYYAQEQIENVAAKTFAPIQTSIIISSKSRVSYSDDIHISKLIFYLVKGD